MKGSFAAFTTLLAIASMQLDQGLADAQALSQDVEVLLVPNVGASFQTVDLYNTYSSPVVVCTYNLPSSASNPATVRMRNVGSTSFEIRIQQFENSSLVTTGNVHCLIVDEGVHTLSDGREIEAHTVVSDATSGNAVGWGSATTERVDSTFGHTFSNLVLLGQVMTFNDVNASVFWTHNCSGRGAPPTDSAACVGKHIGMINSTRANETLGYIAIEAGSGTVNDVDYTFALGSNSIAGTGNSPPYSYSTSGDFDVGVATQAAENGGNGGWAVLYGSDPLPSGAINLAIEEETVAGDTTRNHINEQVAYGVFQNNQTADVSADKTVSIHTDSSVPYAIPGSDVLYTISVTNSGSSPIDDDSLFLVDTLPPETEFFNGDHNGVGSGVVGFAEVDSGLTFAPGSDVRYSNAIAKPTSFSACNYIPNTGYDSNVRHVCFNPKGRLRDGTLYPASAFSFAFRARIN